MSEEKKLEGKALGEEKLDSVSGGGIKEYFSKKYERAAEALFKGIVSKFKKQSEKNRKQNGY